MKVALGIQFFLDVVSVWLGSGLFLEDGLAFGLSGCCRSPVDSPWVSVESWVLENVDPDS